MIVTQHAKERWAERFPDLEIANEYACAKTIGKKTRRKILKNCPNNHEFYRGGFNGRYMLMNRRGCIFVVAPPETIITVLRRDQVDV